MLQTIVVAKATGDENILALVQAGKYPGAERMSKLICVQEEHLRSNVVAAFYLQHKISVKNTIMRYPDYRELIARVV